MAANWAPAKAAQAPEQGPFAKVHPRDNPLTSDDYAFEAPAPAAISTSAPVGFHGEEEAMLTAKKSTINNFDNSKSIGHASRLNRGLVKADVLRRYTTNQPIASFIDVEEGLTEDQRAKMLAERLGSTSEASGLRVTGNAQVELVSHVEGLDKELRRFWGKGEKVRSTRVTIQAIKMLCNPKVPQCYPSIFMLVSNVMDTFGDFVAKRLQELSANGNAVVATLLKKGRDADADLIPAEAVEVCNNWFLKISSIRELVPRICVELSLLKCFRYVSKKMRAAMPDVVERLAGQIRGIADPLVASHIRWYLFLRAAEVLHGPEWAAPLTQCYLDQLQMTTNAATSPSSKYAGASGLALFAPSLQWMLDTLLQFGSVDDRRLIIDKTVEHILTLKCPELSAVLFQSLGFKELSAIGFDNLIAHVGEYTEPEARAVAMSALCLALVDSEVPGATRGAKTAFLSELHGVADLEALPTPQFLIVTEALLLLCSAHFGPKQIHVMLRLVREKISDEPVLLIEEALSGMVSRLIKHFSPGPLLTSPDLVPVVRLASIAARGQIITNLLRAIPSFGSTTNSGSSGSGVGSGGEAHATVALELCRILEQCQAVGSDDRAYAAVVASTLNAVCPSDPEAKLSFLCEARHTLSDAEPLRAALVHIAIRTVESLATTNNRKRRNVAKVFFAFCHVTIPALQNPFTRLKVALLATAVAFKKGLVAYGEGLMHLCVGILPDLEPFTTRTDGTVDANDADTRAVALQLLSIAAAVPPHAKYGHLYAFETVLQWTDSYQWPPSSSSKFTIWLAVARLATRLLRSECDPRQQYPLCGTAHSAADPQFREACEAAAVAAVKRCLFNIERIRTDSPQHPMLHDVCLEGFETVMNFAVYSKSPLARCAGAYFWRTGKEAAASGAVTTAMERARTYAVARLSETEVNEVVYYAYSKDLVFERFGARLATEDASAAVGSSTANANNATSTTGAGIGGGNAYAEDAIPRPAADGPSGPAGASQREHVDPNAEADALAAAAAGDDAAAAADDAEAAALLAELDGGAPPLPAAQQEEANDDDLLGAAEAGGDDAGEDVL